MRQDLHFYMFHSFLELKLKWIPLFLNNNYYSSLFEDDFKAIIPECFLLFSLSTILLYGIIFSSVESSLLFRSNAKQKQNLSNNLSIARTRTTFGEDTSAKPESPNLLTNKSDSATSVSPTSYNPDPRSGLLGIATSWMSILTLFLTIPLLWNNPISEATIFYQTFRLEPLGFFFKMLVIVGTLFSIIIALQYNQQESLNFFELQVLILISTVSMLFLISSADFIWLYLAIELQSLCFYVMAGVKRESEFSSEAGLKYFLLGAFSSGILAFGFALQYGFTGTTQFSELSKIFRAYFSSPLSLPYNLEEEKQNSLTSSSNDFVHLSGAEESSQGMWFSSVGEGSYDYSNLVEIASTRGLELAMVFILVGFLFKLTAVPFHFWSPDVYEGAPTSVTAFFAIVPKISLLAVVLRLCYEVFYDFVAFSETIVQNGESYTITGNSWQKMLFLSSIASMILGSLAALSQNKIKRLLAWSSIGHVGYFLIAICCATTAGIQALVFYLVIYVIMTIAAFQILLCSMRREKIAYRSSKRGYQEAQSEGPLTSSSQKQRLKYTTDLAQLAKSNSVLAISFTIIMFSIAGIPPLAGFYSKAFLLFSAISSGAFVAAIVAIITSVISCFYSIRIVKIIYFESFKKKILSLLVRVSGLTSVKDKEGEKSIKKRAISTKPTKAMQTFIEISKENSLVLGLTISSLSFFCFFPTILFTATHQIALSFCF